MSDRPRTPGKGPTAASPIAVPAKRRALDWMASCLQWGTRVRPGAHGLTLRAINVGVYGDVPDEWHEMSRMPRGAFPVDGVPRLDFYPLTRKSELWAENAPELYEEAVQRRWSAELDTPWQRLAPLDDDVELAMGQLCTELAQQASIETEVLGRWVPRMSFGYHEVKTFLATEAFDASRHVEAFRTRALAKGGALGLESPGRINRRLIECRAGWTETALYLYLVRGSLTLALLRYGEAYGHDVFEKTLFRRCLEDKARHLAYGMGHLRYAIERKGAGFALGLVRLLTGVEHDLDRDLGDPVLWEALAIVFGGGVRHIDEGMRVAEELRRHCLRDYLRRLNHVGIAKTVDDLDPGLQAWLD